MGRVVATRPAKEDWTRLGDLTSVLTRPINFELIASQYDEFVKYASAMKSNTADPETLLSRFTRAGVLHPTYKALVELGRAGKPCIAFEDVEPQRKGMAVTRSSGRPMTDFNTIMEALTAHATRAAEKLRQHGLIAGSLTAFYHTSRFRTDQPNHRASRTALLMPMSNDTFDLVAAARRCAEAAWQGPRDLNQGGYAYSKAGVMLDDLLPIAQRPLTLSDESEVGPVTS